MRHSELPAVVFVADRDPVLLNTLREQVSGWGYDVYCARSFAQVTQQLAATPADLVLMDLPPDDRECLALMAELMQTDGCPPIIVLTASSCIETAVQATKLGACDYIAEPRDLGRLKRAVAQAVEKHRLARRVKSVTSSAQNETAQKILGTSAAIQRTRDLIADVAVTDAKVLILGESGTGKELVANAIHQQSRRSQRVFAPVNMAALPPTLAESVLFGHEKGSFTGAEMLQRGWCEMADKGSLFLDEIGEMDLGLQAKLLRFLQDGSFQRIGSSKAQTVDVRIIAATNRDPAALVRDGRLREDLYYRLNVLPIVIPPLRDRREDITLLAQVFLERSAKTHGKPVVEFTPAALEVITSFDWPGNVRQLENTVERMVILSRDSAIGIADLPADILGGEPYPGRLSVASEAPPVAPNLDMRNIEKDAILNALSQEGGNVVRAARILGLGQATVYRKIKRYDIRVERRSRREPNVLRTSLADPLESEN